MLCKNRGIYGFLRATWVLIILPPRTNNSMILKRLTISVRTLFLRVRERLPARKLLPLHTVSSRRYAHSDMPVHKTLDRPSGSEVASS